MAEKLAAAGFACISFNFSHNGVGGNLFEFDELEKFQENTFSFEEQDLQMVITALKKGDLPCAPWLDSVSIGLIGHSRGGSAVLCVGVLPEVKAVATVASISQMPLPLPEQERQWREDGVINVENARTGQKLPLGVSLLEDMLLRRKSIENAVKSLSKPLLIIHGDNDQAVSLSQALELQSWNPSAQLEILSGGSHTFGIKHPFSGSTPEFEKVISLLITFFKEIF